ncbi:ribonuclease D [Mangrovimicrobium sediminis]|uniref:ribonuclease D n=1 Tax=Mangrovimicrobium sediminis TaxID=2562682 RepID=UPI0014367628|nr:ribonuclease D [Haliea sp. SAOS-164]
MDWQLLESDQALAQLLEGAKGCTAVMVDTEFMRRNTFYPQVALVQLCFHGGEAAGTAWLVDPLRIEDPAPLAALFADPAVTKVLHSASEDLEVFQQWLGVLPQPLFDTQKAAALAGMDFGMGYRNIVLALCEEDLPKGETRSDWLQRPLTESQCHYAAQDVIWLLEVYRELAVRCRESGRYDWVLAEGEEACANLASGAGGYYRKLKNAWKLRPRELARLAAICDWRDEVARREDRPRSWIIDDPTCFQAARLRPETSDDLRRKLEMHPSALRRYGQGLLQVLDDCDGLPDDALPAPLPAPLSAAQREQLKRLKARLEAIAGEMGVAPQALLANRDLEILLRGGEEPAAWSGWRRDCVIEPLRTWLQGAGA